MSHVHVFSSIILPERRVQACDDTARFILQAQLHQHTFQHLKVQSSCITANFQIQPVIRQIAGVSDKQHETEKGLFF